MAYPKIESKRKGWLGESAFNTKKNPAVGKMRIARKI